MPFDFFAAMSACADAEKRMLVAAYQGEVAFTKFDKPGLADAIDAASKADEEIHAAWYLSCDYESEIWGANKFAWESMERMAKRGTEIMRTLRGLAELEGDGWSKRVMR